MARIDALPSLEIIRGLKGILDFYVWRGLPCVRAWPKYRPARQTAASLAAALVFGAIVKSYSLLGDVPLEAYRQDARDQPRTARDIMVTGVYGNLHEASMSDFLTLLVECRDFLSDLTALLNALDSIDTDELVVNVDQTVLPPLAATTTNQGLIYARLGLIDDLADALESNALDRLLVRGSDQLFSFADLLHTQATGAISGADGFIDSPAPGSGIVWIVTTIAARNQSNPCTTIGFDNVHNASGIPIHGATQAIAAWETIPWAGHTVLNHNDVIRAWFGGALGGDTVQVALTGYIMTLET